MPFPTTNVLDTFTGTDEDPITTNWSTPVRTGSGNVERWSGTAEGPGDAWYDLEEFGPDIEVYCTLAAVSAIDTNHVGLLGCIDGEGTSSATFYWLTWYRNGASWYVSVSRYNTGTYTNLVSEYGPVPTLVAGDGIGMEIVGNVIKAYHRSSGVWSNIYTYDDSGAGGKITTAGFIGFQADDSDFKVDDFGGGNYQSVTLDSVLPDADITTTGWSTAPLFSKINDASDATVITATAS